MTGLSSHLNDNLTIWTCRHRHASKYVGIMSKLPSAFIVSWVGEYKLELIMCSIIKSQYDNM